MTLRIVTIKNLKISLAYVEFRYAEYRTYDRVLCNTGKRLRPVDLIKLFWSKFSNSFCKLDQFIHVKNTVRVHLKQLAYKSVWVHLDKKSFLRSTPGAYIIKFSTVVYDNDYSPIINIYFYKTFSTLTQNIQRLRSTLQTPCLMLE